jgi:hypothetical protein
MIFEGLTLQDLRDATHAELMQGIHFGLVNYTKKELCEIMWSMKSMNPFGISITTQIVNHSVPEGQLLRIHETTDILANKLSSQKTEWTYYPTGEVDTITTTELDALDQIISQKTIKHFTDGRQPVLVQP